MVYAESWQPPSFPCVLCYLTQGWTIKWFPLMKILVRSFKRKSLQCHRVTMANLIPEGFQSHSGRTTGMELLESLMWLKGHKVSPGGHLCNPGTEEQHGFHQASQGGFSALHRAKEASQALPHFLPALSLHGAPELKACSSLNTENCKDRKGSP